MRRNPTYYSVRPRFTPGSPGQVDEELALRVASQEKESYQAALEGIYGEEDLHKAKELGLKGIVEAMVEVRGGFNITDLITGEKCWRGSIKPAKIQKGDRLLEQRLTVTNAMGKHSYQDGTEYGFYTDRHEFQGDNGYMTFGGNDLIKIERKREEEN